MRQQARRTQQEDEEESSFVSMTDMAVSFLFIVMILLAFFAAKYSSEEMIARTEYDIVVKKNVQLKAEVEALKSKVEELEAIIRALRQHDPLEIYMARAAALRLKILEELKQRIKQDFPDLKIEISAESDALRFQGEGLFRTNESTLRPEPLRIVETIAQRLHEILPCYTLGKPAQWSDSCNPGHAIIEAVQIEGHTDSQGSDQNNLILSTARANSTFAAMVSHQPELIAFLNYRDQPVMSVAGYGLMRPVATNDTVEGRSTNRRIDLRIIMFTPANSEEIDKIRQRLQIPHLKSGE
jgi:outer membrane protein OmpA-like peptidoglycan-associated protein